MRETLESFRADLRAGNAEAACQLMSKPAQAKLIVNVREDPLQRPTGARDIDTCVEAMPALFDRQPTKVTEVRVDGDRARGRIERRGRKGSYDGGTVELVIEGDHWRIGPRF